MWKQQKIWLCDKAKNVLIKKDMASKEYLRSKPKSHIKAQQSFLSLDLISASSKFARNLLKRTCSLNKTFVSASIFKIVCLCKSCNISEMRKRLYWKIFENIYDVAASSSYFIYRAWVANSYRGALITLWNKNDWAFLQKQSAVFSS